MDAAILSGLVAVIVALIGLIGVLWRRGGVVPNPPNPDATQSGQVSTTYWLGQFERLYDKLSDIEKLLAERLPKG